MTTSQIAYFDGAKPASEEWPRIAGRIGAVIDASAYVDGHEVTAIEADIRRYTGARHAIACGSGTEALVLLLAAAGVGPGDDVVVPAFSFIATATTVSMLGANAVFVDIEPESYAMDPARLEAALTPQTRAVVPVHLFTQPADMTAITAVATTAGTTVIEDSAEGIGMRHDGVHTGLLGSGGVLSFFPTKTLGALGDAGMVITSDDQIGARCRSLRGQVCASLMDDIQAVVLRERMRRLDRDIALRAELAAAYDSRLAALAPFVTVPVIRQRTVPVQAVYYVYLIEAQAKCALVRHLKADGIETEEYYPQPIPFQPCYRWRGYRPGHFPVAERACARTVALPLYPGLSMASVDRVCDSIARFYEGGGQP